MSREQHCKKCWGRLPSHAVTCDALTPKEEQVKPTITLTLEEYEQLKQSPDVAKVANRLGYVEEPKQVQAPAEVWVRWDVFGNPHAEPGPHYPDAVRYVKAGGQ